ncbi:MAG TPA: glycoside hydrolase family 15 protein [Xanthobacteraceae bacterium]|jgi:GH15 family glucan-1,4-alpha-glucosidase|nr:glycoside hydrolase family 15 protein [Xanthobacteraceae bacterium]
MERRIEDYGLIGNARTAALVGRDCSIDWLCLPRFDSPACFAALLGSPENGRWIIEPAEPEPRISRRYRDGTGILETRFETDTGSVVIIDFMPLPVDDLQIDLVRMVRGERGSVAMSTEILFRFDYGRVIPWVRRRGYGLSAIVGPDEVQLRSDIPLHGEQFTTRGNFTVDAGESVCFVLNWRPSHRRTMIYREPEEMLRESETSWRMWTARCTLKGPWSDAVIRSLITLKLLTFYPTGGIIAAPTTSLPELLGGPRNWDYRYCWIRDATFSLNAFMAGGYGEEARAWRNWLLRAAAGRPEELQIMYGVAGERFLDERELPWLPGFLNSKPVRIGNAAYQQLQLDVYGELMDVLFAAEKVQLEPSDDAWGVQRALLTFLEQIWTKPDAGLWEVRGPVRHFTHSKVMAWVAFDRAVKMVERSGLVGPVDRWRRVRDQIHAQVCDKGFDARRNTFVQAYGSSELDASLLLLPHVGFLPPSDPRIIGTIEAVERELMVDGLVLRYRSQKTEDGLPGQDGPFLACSFWLADALALIGRDEEAWELFEHLLSLRNDLGLLAEEYDPRRKCFLGNFPQAFSHVALVNTAFNLMQGKSDAQYRANTRSKTPDKLSLTGAALAQ